MALVVYACKSIRSYTYTPNLFLVEVVNSDYVVGLRPEINYAIKRRFMNYRRTQR
jgi:hypothetical protein